VAGPELPDEEVEEEEAVDGAARPRVLASIAMSASRVLVAALCVRLPSWTARTMELSMAWRY
jgi:hypothetical protein